MRYFASTQIEQTLKAKRYTDMTGKSKNRPFSSLVVDGNEKAAARAMLYAVGFTEEDFGKSELTEKETEVL